MDACFLDAVLLLESNVFGVQGIDTINHALDEFDLGVTQAMLVGDVISVTSLAARFTAGTTGLNLKLFTSLLKGVKTFLGPAGQVNVDGSPHAGAKVGRAGVDETVLSVEHEVLATLGLDGVTDGLNTAGKALEDASDITALLHGDDPELILFIDPDQESLLGVVVDTTTFRPVALHTCDLKVAITRHEEEVVINELLADLLVHASQGVVVASEVTGELAEGTLHEVLNTDALVLGDTRGETKAINAAAYTDPDGVDGDFGVNVTLDLLDVHVGGVDGIRGDAMVFLDDGIEDILEILVGIPVTGVDTAVLVVELDGASNGLLEGEAGGGCLVGSEFIPALLGDVLSHKGVGTLDFRVWFGHLVLGVLVDLRGKVEKR